MIDVVCGFLGGCGFSSVIGGLPGFVFVNSGVVDVFVDDRNGRAVVYGMSGTSFGVGNSNKAVVEFGDPEFFGRLRFFVEVGLSLRAGGVVYG